MITLTGRVGEHEQNYTHLTDLLCLFIDIEENLNKIVALIRKELKTK